tara:strand:+ start:818 stop:1060 length:243 start_codon:yes stop_codon:yes gene_type:complete
MATDDTRFFNGKYYDAWHGSPFDRGSADSWYDRAKSPHYYPNGTGNNPRIEPPEMKDSEVKAYLAGHAYNEQHGGKKDWD